ncbi:HB1, ASXL, restriction endonuclease HTH domain-containing protein [Dunaliella salina]|uniref:HB1, ASXL, restriction endonuclease HTH domain-containing protein n=1 Tax=Dunaliella salina TaxID=3046 RepID=A0ABQ7GH01_DUNSA|nr:HB1, ASXL, restriction endonuclease HTH domain-containing protein [Dunaliella salina]|eukprot:KAF5833881.1 HB1, ASXL, restriction endonuclease HTH domain-containing protein [Dunaliella salina]
MKNRRSAEGVQEQEANKTCLGGGMQPISGGGGIFKSAAVRVLQLERKLMTTGDITKVALERGLILSQGKTPEATMASALYTDVKRKADRSAFTRPQEGLFGLRTWIEEGFFPDGWSGSASGVAPFKKRNAAPKAQTRRPAGRAAKGRAQASFQASEERDEEASGVADDHEYEDAEGGGGDPAATSEEAEDVSFKSPAPTTRARGAGLPSRAACSREASGGRNLPSSSGQQQQEQQQGQQPAQPVQDPHEEGMGDESGGGRGELESPLHMLGDAALNTFGRPGGGPARLNVNGKRPRKRPAGLGIQVPESSANGRFQDGTSTPKSPFEDSLAALHEIATSPLPYAASNGAQSDPLDRRCRPRLGAESGRVQDLPSAPAWRQGGVSTMKGLISIMPLQWHPDEQLQGAGQAGDDTAEAACMQIVAERLEARLGRKNPQVGKAWIVVARMHHCLGEQRGDATMMQRALQAVKHAQEVCSEAARALGTTSQCDAHFATLREALSQSKAVGNGRRGGEKAGEGQQVGGGAGGEMHTEKRGSGPGASKEARGGESQGGLGETGSSLMMPPPPPPALQHVPAK